MQIEDYLNGKKLNFPFRGKKFVTIKDEEWTLLDRQVLGVIWLTLSKLVAHNVVKENTIKDLMTDFSSMYENCQLQQGASDKVVQSEAGRRYL